MRYIAPVRDLMPNARGCHATEGGRLRARRRRRGRKGGARSDIGTGRAQARRLGDVSPGCRFGARHQGVRRCQSRMAFARYVDEPRRGATLHRRRQCTRHPERSSMVSSRSPGSAMQLLPLHCWPRVIRQAHARLPRRRGVSSKCHRHLRSAFSNALASFSMTTITRRGWIVSCSTTAVGRTNAMIARRSRAGSWRFLPTLWSDRRQRRALPYFCARRRPIN